MSGIAVVKLQGREYECSSELAEAIDAALEQARGFRDAWKASAKEWRARARACEQALAIKTGAVQFEHWRRELLEDELNRLKETVKQEEE